MNARSLLAVLLLLGTGLTGCLGGDDAQTPAATDDGNTTAPTTAAPDGRGSLVAFEETNETVEGSDGVDHHHDYWQGRERVTVFEQVVKMEPFPGGGTSQQFRPKEPGLIYEGTASVEITFTNPRRHACEPLITFGTHYMCTDHLVYTDQNVPPVDDPMGGPTGLTIRYKHASTIEWIDAGEVAWDSPITIKVTHPTQTDMPHATSSAWEFLVVSPNDADTTLMFDAKADVVRATGTDIPKWPGHPMFYTPDRMSRVVVNEFETWACDSGFTNTGCLSAGGDTEEAVPDKLISYGTRTLFVWVNISEVTVPNEATAPNSWFLYHSNVTGKPNATRTVDAENYPISQREFLWILPVDDGAMDSPYSDGSKWAFSLGASYVPPDNPAIGSCYGGCAEWSAKYKITVIASAEVLPASVYHINCLDTQQWCPERQNGGGGSEDDGARIAPVGPAYTADELRARGLRY